MSSFFKNAAFMRDLLFSLHFRQTAGIMITAVQNTTTLSFGHALLGDH